MGTHFVCVHFLLFGQLLGFAELLLLLLGQFNWSLWFLVAFRIVQFQSHLDALVLFSLAQPIGVQAVDNLVALQDDLEDGEVYFFD